MPLALMQRHSAKAESMLKQLANRRRLMVLCHLVGEEKSVGQLEELVGLSQSALSQHLARMRKSGLIKAQKRGKMVYYSIASVEAQALLSTLHLLYCRP